MRLSAWQSRSPNRDSLSPKVMTPAADALALLGADRDPDSRIPRGDDPGACDIALPGPAAAATPDAAPR